MVSLLIFINHNSHLDFQKHSSLCQEYQLKNEYLPAPNMPQQFHLHPL